MQLSQKLSFKMFLLLLLFSFQTVFTIVRACEFNATHCTCLFSVDISTSRCYRPITETTCLVDTCLAAYKCDCSGNTICDITTCGAWRPNVAGDEIVGTTVDCYYADQNTAEAASCLGGPVAVVSPSPTATSSTSPTPSASPIVPICPGDEPSLSVINYIDATYTYDSPGTISYPSTGHSIQVYGAGINNTDPCNLYPTPEEPNPDAPDAWMLRAEYGGRYGECATTGVNNVRYDNYVIYGFETDGTYYFQPTIDVFDVDNQYSYTNLSEWDKYPKDMLGMIGFRNGEIITPTISINSPSTTILEERSYRMRDADVVRMGETTGRLDIPTVTIPDISNAICGSTTWDTCTATFTFNEPVTKFWILASAQYDVPSLVPNQIEIGVNPFQWTC